MNDIFKDKVKELHISPLQIAKQAGIPYTTVNRLLNDKTEINNCPVYVVNRLAMLFDCQIEDLMDQNSYMENVENTYRGITYKWKKENGRMHILFEDNGKHIDLDTGCLMMVPSRKKEYNLVGEMLIDEYMENKEFEKAAAEIERKMRNDG